MTLRVWSVLVLSFSSLRARIGKSLEKKGVMGTYGRMLADCAFENLVQAVCHVCLVGLVHDSVLVDIALHRNGDVLYVAVRPDERYDVIADNRVALDRRSTTGREGCCNVGWSSNVLFGTKSGYVISVDRKFTSEIVRRS